MNESNLRAWWWHRQGLDGSLRGKSPAEILGQSGWARSVGGVGPYVSLFARGGTSRDEADAAVAALEIHELPAARGCTYVVPANDFEIALTVAQAFGEGDMKTAAKLGVTEKEVDKLCDAVLGALGDEPLDPEAIKALVGKAVRNLGEEGKKKGMITTLPLALGRLQASGLIRRVPVGGRLDQQRYKYVRWSKGPLAKSKLSSGDAFTELARRFFRWVGPATMKEFQWFSGLGVKTANDAAAPLGLVPANGTDRLLLPDDAAAFSKCKAPKEAQYALVSSLDAISAARRDVSTLVDESDRDAVSNTDFGDRPRALMDLAAHAILDRGRLIGYWEYDVDAQRIVWATFAKKKDTALERAVEDTQAYVRDQLGDARSFSLDSPKSRRPKLEALARAAAAVCLTFLVAGCQGSDGMPRLAPTRTAATLACMLSSPKPPATTAQMMKACEKVVPRIELIGLDQLAIDRVLAGVPGSEDPGIRTPCSGGDPDRVVSGVETMGYGVVVNGQAESVTLLKSDKVVTYHRDGSSESTPVAAPATGVVADSTVAPSACAMAIAQALTVVSQCEGQQWTGRGCATLLTLMAYCPDPMRLMIDPDIGYACQPKADADAVRNAAMKACASRGNAGSPCKPEVATNGWLRDPGGICASPSAMVSADQETCVVPVAVSGPRGSADVTALIIWGKTTSGGPVFTPEPTKSPGG